MKKKILFGGLLLVFALTGCGMPDKISQYSELDNIPFIDTQKDINVAKAEIKNEDLGQWSYREENIEKVIQLENEIRKSCNHAGTRITVTTSNDDSVSFTTLKEHSRKGKDAKKETLMQYSINIYAKDISYMKENCKVLEKLGFEGISEGVSRQKFFYQKGYQILTENEDEYSGDEETDNNIESIVTEDDTDLIPENYFYGIHINIPSIMLYGPECYFDLSDLCFESDLYVRELLCLGGAVDGITIRNNNINITAIAKQGKILNFKAARKNDWKEGNFFTEKEQGTMAEFLTSFCQNKNTAIQAIKEMTKEGRKGGKEGDFSWRIYSQYVADTWRFVLEIE